MGLKYLIQYWENLVLKDRPSLPEKLLLLFLSFFACFYHAAVLLRNKAYDFHMIPILDMNRPVISVGNLSVGGTGKTSLVLWLAQFLKSKNKKVVILSRGYKRSQGTGDIRIVSDENQILGESADSGDEAFLMAQKSRGVPVLSGSDRGRSATLAKEKFNPDVILMDDGFQHRRIHRNLNIACLDERTYNAPRIFPRGLLREPFSSLKRADFIVTKAKINSRAPSAHEFTTRSIPHSVFSYKAKEIHDKSLKNTHPVHWLKERKIIAFSGIADPESFEELLRQSGAKIVSSRRFLDHHSYTEEDLQKLLEESKKLEAVLVTTEKDLVKLPNPYPALALNIELDWQEGAKELEEAVLNSLKSETYAQK